ncbi:MAG: hypothetical protein ACRD3W_25050 [Terriglobales bacterium]
MHEFDPFTECCTKCGQTTVWVARHGVVRCHGGGNLVAISHIVRRKRLMKLLEQAIF